MTSTTIAYHGLSINNLVRLLITGGSEWLYVTDEPNAGRYANAQATGKVDVRYTPLASGAAIIGVEIPANTQFTTRPSSHHTLDTLEAVVPNGAYRLVSVKLKFSDYENTYYGAKWHMEKRNEILARLVAMGIQVIEI